MLRAVKRAHAWTAFYPNNQVFKLGVDVPTCCDQLVSVAPIHAHEMDSTVLAVLRECGAAEPQKFNELFPAEFSGSLSKLPMPNLSFSRDMAIYFDIVG